MLLSVLLVGAPGPGPLLERFDIHVEILRLQFNGRTLEAYRPRPYPVKLTLFRAAKHPVSAHSDAALGWRRLAGGGIEIHAVPGDYLRVIEEPHCRVLPERLKATLHEAAENGRIGV